jgi:16S rRNA (cytidine1402-2'-O)-methyltransferase
VDGTRAHDGGRIVLVATPIGNLGDLSPRALEALATADVVAAEDTRRTGRLLAHHDLSRPLVRLDDHTERDRAPDLVRRAAEGQTVVVATDAGTPGISDPGYVVVRAAVDAGVSVELIPGPVAAVHALVLSGLPTDRFVFEGFLPRRARQRRERVADLPDERRTIVCYLSPHRAADELDDLAAALGSRPAALARELTKLHEQIVRAPLGELVSKLGEEVPLLGEFVVVVAGAEADEAGDPQEIRRVFGLLAETMSRREAVALCARITGRPRNEVYDLTRAGSG